MTETIGNAALHGDSALAAFHHVPQPTYEEALAKWELAKRMMNAWQTHERELRVALFGGAVPTPKEGVNNVELQDGRVCKFDYKINCKLTDAMAARAALVDVGVNDVDALIKPKYELAVGPYKKLTGPAREALDKFVESKPGLPTLEVK